jgi:hypothetical protein
VARQKPVCEASQIETVEICPLNNQPLCAINFGIGGSATRMPREIDFYILLLHILYVSTAICYIVYNASVKFRFRNKYNARNEHFFASFLFAFSILLSGFGIGFIGQFVNFTENYSEFDRYNLILIVALLVVAKIVANNIDHLPGMSDIIKAKEPRQYSLIRQFSSHLPLIMIPIILLSSRISVKAPIYDIYTAFAIAMLIMEGWERIIPLRLSYLMMKIGHIINNDDPEKSRAHIKIKYLLVEKAEKFWFREISGSVVKSAVNCWACFVILVLIVHSYDHSAFYIEANYQGLAQLSAPTQQVRQQAFDISSAFYMVASEMFFGDSGIFPQSAAAKVVYFFMHAFGLFLYGVFFTFGVQAYTASNDRREI